MSNLHTLVAVIRALCYCGIQHTRAAPQQARERASLIGTSSAGLRYFEQQNTSAFSPLCSFLRGAHLFPRSKLHRPFMWSSPTLSLPLFLSFFLFFFPFFFLSKFLGHTSCLPHQVSPMALKRCVKRLNRASGSWLLPCQASALTQSRLAIWAQLCLTYRSVSAPLSLLQEKLLHNFLALALQHERRRQAQPSLYSLPARTNGFFVPTYLYSC